MAARRFASLPRRLFSTTKRKSHIACINNHLNTKVLNLNRIKTPQKATYSKCLLKKTLLQPPPFVPPGCGPCCPDLTLTARWRSCSTKNPPASPTWPRWRHVSLEHQGHFHSAIGLKKSHDMSPTASIMMLLIFFFCTPLLSKKMSASYCPYSPGGIP